MILLGVRDLVRLYRKSPSAWSNIMKRGTLKNQKTSSGRITTKEWVEEYLSTKGLKTTDK